MKRFMTALVASVILALPSLAGAAGLHFPTDDSGVLERGQIQLEGWVLRTDGRNGEYALLPTFGITAALDLGLGVIRVREEGDYLTRLEPEAKWALPVELPAGWSGAIGLIVGVEDGRVEDWFLNLPFTREFEAVPLALHLNAGWLRVRDPERGNLDRMFVGVGAEWELAPRVGLIGQAYREGADAEPEAQIGVRVAVGERLESLDFVVGRPLRGDDQDWFVVAGFTALF